MIQNKLFLSNFTHYFNNLKTRPLALYGSFTRPPINCLLSHQMFGHRYGEINGFQKSFKLLSKSQESYSFKNYFSKMSEAKCWNCQQILELKGFKCALCGALQYPKANANYFKIFGISQIYNIDVEDLSSKFKNLQMSFHPDKFVNKTKTELEISEMYSRLLNKAYTTLKDPLARGFYLLKLQKVSMADASVEQEFLVSIMDKNEELEIIDNKNDLMKFVRTIRTDVDKQIRIISGAFKHGKWEEAKMSLLKLSYLFKLEEKIKGKAMELNSANKS